MKTKIMDYSLIAMFIVVLSHFVLTVGSVKEMTSQQEAMVVVDFLTLSIIAVALTIRVTWPVRIRP